MKTPNTIPDLIGKWDKLTEFASAVGCGYEAARKMRDRSSIAPEHWQSIIRASEAKGVEGVTLEWLASQRVGTPEPALIPPPKPRRSTREGAQA